MNDETFVSVSDGLNSSTESGVPSTLLVPLEVSWCIYVTWHDLYKPGEIAFGIWQAAAKGMKLCN